MALFQCNRNCTVGNVTLKEVTIDDEQLFYDFLSQSDYTRVSYYNSFYYLCSMNLNKVSDSKFMYAIIGDWLLTFELDYNKGFILKNSPINRYGNYENMGHILKVCFGIVSRLNKNIRIEHHRVYNMLKLDFSEYLVKRNVSRFMNNYKEFIFRCSDLIELKGKIYKSCRHMVNKLYTNYPDFVMREYDPTVDKIGALNVYKNWVKRYNDRLNGAEVTDVGLATNILETISEKPNNRCKIFVGIINGNIEGFIIIVPLCKNTKCVLSEYTDVDIKGLAETMWYEGLRRTTDLGEFENDGTGGPDDDGLFQYKNKHKPIGFLEACEFILNKNGQKINNNIFKRS